MPTPPQSSRVDLANGRDGAKVDLLLVVWLPCDSGGGISHAEDPLLPALLIG